MPKKKPVLLLLLLPMFNSLKNASHEYDARKRSRLSRSYAYEVWFSRALLHSELF